MKNEIDVSKLRCLNTGNNWPLGYNALFGGDVPVDNDEPGPTACLGSGYDGMVPEEFEGKCIVLGVLDGFKWKLIEPSDECVWPLLVLVEED